MSGCVQELFSEAQGITYQVMLHKAAAAPCLGMGWCLILWSKRMNSHWAIRKKLFQIPGACAAQFTIGGNRAVVGSVQQNGEC